VDIKTHFTYLNAYIGHCFIKNVNFYAYKFQLKIRFKNGTMCEFSANWTRYVYVWF